MRAEFFLAPLLAAAASVGAGPVLDFGKAAPFDADMRPIEVNGLKLVDAEYLPFEGLDPLRYPEDVLFGFYADGTTQAAQDCALLAFSQVRSIFVEPLPELREVVALGATRFFYLWINDYSDADPSRSRRPARVWHWGAPADDFAVGYWKWEVTVSQSGACQLPRREQARAAFQAAIDTINDAESPQ